MRRLQASAIGLAALAGCGGDSPADVAGDYSVVLTNREDGCQLGWEVGMSSQDDIPVVITQNDASATAEVGGAGALVLNTWLGDATFVGSVSGNDIELELESDNNLMMGDCDYHFVATIDASLSGDTLTGEIRYQTVTDGVPDCSFLEGCVSRQDFNGVRPP